MATTAGTLTHRYSIIGTNRADVQVSKTRYNDSFILASAAPDGSVLVRDSAQADGWGLLPLAGPLTRKVAATAAQTLASLVVGAADASFQVSANINVTTATSHNFTVTVTYTDEQNVSRTLTLGFIQLSGATFLTAITNTTGAGPYHSPVLPIRAKAGTTITIATVGTFTTVTYNAEGLIRQVAV